jgi:hypothetical protein
MLPLKTWERTVVRRIPASGPEQRGERRGGKGGEGREGGKGREGGRGGKGRDREQ